MRKALGLILTTVMLAGCSVATKVKDDARTYTRGTGKVLVKTGKDIGSAGKSAGQEVGAAAQGAGETLRDGGKAAKRVITD